MFWIGIALIATAILLAAIPVAGALLTINDDRKGR